MYTEKNIVKKKFERKLSWYRQLIKKKNKRLIRSNFNSCISFVGTERVIVLSLIQQLSFFQNVNVTMSILVSFNSM